MARIANPDEPLISALASVAKLAGYKPKRLSITDDLTTRVVSLSFARESGGVVQDELPLFADGVTTEYTPGPEYRVAENGNVELPVDREVPVGVATDDPASTELGPKGRLGQAYPNPEEGQEYEDNGVLYRFRSGNWYVVERPEKPARRRRNLAEPTKEDPLPTMSEGERDEVWPEPEEGTRYIDSADMKERIFWAGEWILADQQQPVGAEA